MDSLVDMPLVNIGNHESTPRSKSLFLKLIFSDEKTKFVRVNYPYVVPTMEDTLFHKHIMEHYVPANHSKSLICDDDALLPLRLEYTADIYPHVVSIWREGCLLTPPAHLLHEVWSFVDYVSGSNSIWIDFATYLSKPLLKFGIRFIPEPMVVISHELCKNTISDPLFIKISPNILEECRNRPAHWIAAALELFKFRVISFSPLPDHQFELVVRGLNKQQVHLTSTKIQKLFLARYESSSNDINYKGNWYNTGLLKDSPLHGTTFHFQLLFTVEWIMPYLDCADQLKEEIYGKSIETFRSLGLVTKPSL